MLKHLKKYDTHSCGSLHISWLKVALVDKFGVVDNSGEMRIVVGEYIKWATRFKNNRWLVSVKLENRFVEIIPNEFAVLVEDLLKLAAIEVLNPFQNSQALDNSLVNQQKMSSYPFARRTAHVRCYAFNPQRTI